GRYEGVDQRVRDHLVDGELSIGDFVLAGGEVAAMAVLEAVGRLVPGVMGNADSADEESFADGLLEYPQYTRPAEFRGWEVPEVLRSGDHARVARWRRAQAVRRTLAQRPDLVEASPLTPEELDVLRDSGACLVNSTDLVDRTQLRDDIPDFAPGDTLKVHVRVVEGSRERTQV